MASEKEVNNFRELVRNILADPTRWSRALALLAALIVSGLIAISPILMAIFG